MVYIVWFLKIIPSVVVETFAKIISPILPFFCDKDGWLPSWLSWFQTPDNSCDGDRGHLARWPKNGVFWTWLRRTAWLFRNSAYGFNLKLGFKYKDGDVRIDNGNTDVGDKSGISGVAHYRVYRDNKLVSFQEYIVYHYKIFGIWRCVRIGLGYKIWSEPTSKVYGQHWVYFNPFKGSGRNNR